MMVVSRTNFEVSKISICFISEFYHLCLCCYARNPSFSEHTTYFSLKMGGMNPQPHSTPLVSQLDFVKFTVDGNDRVGR